MAASPTSARSTAGSRRAPDLGHEVPRIFTPPLRELTAETSAGFSVIEFAIMLGVVLLPWQRWFLIHALELRPDGRLRFRTVVLLVARQNGKSTVSWILALWFMYVQGVALVLGTAQDLDVAEEIWQTAVDVASEHEELSEEIARVVRENGKKALQLVTGSRYKVKAANRRGGRGLTGDFVMLDELREHTSWDAWSAITKTTLTKDYALILALSNAGDASSIVLRHLRRLAHLSLGDPDGIWAEFDAAAGADVADEDPDEITYDDDLAIFEWSAFPGCDIWDRLGWAQGNPAMNHTLPEANIASAARTDPQWEFRTEVLCQWADTAIDGPFPPGSWEAGWDAESEIPAGADVCYAVDTSWDRTMSYVAVAGLRSDGLPHVEVAAQRSGTEWVVSRRKRPDGTDEMLGWFADRATEARPMTVAVQAKGAPASSLLADLAAVPHVTVVEWSGSELGAASGQFFDLVSISGLHEEVGGPPVLKGLRHRRQPVLDIAAATAVTKPLGDSWVWNRKASPNDVAPLVAATGAVWGALQRAEVPFVSAYATHGVEVI